MNPHSLERWRQRLDRAGALISERLDDPPSLQELAAAAAVSPFHFHRIWRALTGETVAETLRRLRLEASQDLLMAGEANVTQTAMAVGFGTPQSFARAFRRHTGHTPSELRTGPSVDGRSPSSDFDVAVEMRGETAVVALRRTGGAHKDLNASFGQVWAWAARHDLLDRLEGIYGVPLDDPESVAEAALRYDACLAVGEVAPPDPFHLLMLPGGLHARSRLTGPYDGLEAATQRLVGEWLTVSEWEPADFPVHYAFLNDPDETPPDQLLTDILLPLRPQDREAT